MSQRHSLERDAVSDAPGTPLLTVSGISVAFPGVQALDDVSFELRRGEVHAIVGENGAGKSTLMKVLAGIHPPDSGILTLDGEEVQITSPRHAHDLGISTIHQEFNLMPDLTIAQNIFIGRERRIAGVFIDDRSQEERTRSLFDRLGLALDPGERVENLTVARQQMVEIAKALSFNARVLIMDEPTAALNEAEVETLLGLIRRFRTPDTAVIYITHRMHELTRISDRVTVLRDGRNVTTLETASTTVPEVIPLMVGRAIQGEQRPAGGHDHGDIVLSVRGLSTRRLLDDINFDLRRGEILGFAGLMGAGRTELGRALVGADHITSGSIWLHGQPVSVANPAVAAGLGIGYLSEDRKRFGVVLEQSVSANIILNTLSDYVGPMGLMKDDAIERKVKASVETLQIRTPSTRQRVKNLSGGNQQKVVIAKWLAKNCDVLVFDEPTRGIDVGAKEEIYRLLNELAARGKSIIMISSELPEVLRMSHRVAVMCEGRLTVVLDNADATQEIIMDHATRFSAAGTVKL